MTHRADSLIGATEGFPDTADVCHGDELDTLARCNTYTEAPSVATPNPAAVDLSTVPGAQFLPTGQ